VSPDPKLPDPELLDTELLDTELLDTELLDTELLAERAHLRHARDCLGGMRESTERIGDYGVDSLASESLGKLRAQRLSALNADPDAPPFFGRTDRDGTDQIFDSGEDGGQDGVERTGRNESLHIGRRHIRDQNLDPVVIDWRAPIARPFYRASPSDRMGVTLRRRFGFGHGAQTGQLTSYEDEHLDLGERLGLESHILREEIERPRVGPMRDIVSTIQPDQDDLVRAELDTSLCIQGAPGTGKTAVGLHRAAYLLYSFPERLRRTGVLVVGPNAAFLHYIAQVLPALGEGGIAQATVDDLVAHAEVRAADEVPVAVLKGDRRMAEVLAAAVRSHIVKPTEDVLALVGTRRYRIGAHHLRRYVDDARRQLHSGDLGYQQARERLMMQVAEDVRRQREAVGGAPSDAETRKLARSRPVREAIDAVWPAIDAAALLVRLYSDDAFLARCAPELSAEERALLQWPTAPRSTRAAKWSGADLVLLDELRGLLNGTDAFVHVVVDEAQDLSAMQCRAVARRSPLGSMTVLGDLAQATTPWAPGSWPATLMHLGHPEAEVRPLTTGYRVPGEVLTIANLLLPHIAPELPPASSVRAGVGSVSYRGRAELVEVVTGLVGPDSEGSVGVIVADVDGEAVVGDLLAAGVDARSLADEADGRVTVVPASQAKGLEFDVVVLVEPADIVAAESSRLAGLRRLYVVLTRAVSQLVLVHDNPLPDEITPAIRV
jgi:DNA helicase IV